jgi:hypothetical protein
MTGSGRPSIVDRLREAGRAGEVLRDLLGLDEIPEPGAAIHCPHPEKHAHGDADPSFLTSRDLAGGRCKAPKCGFGGGLLTIAADRLGLDSEAAAAVELEARYPMYGSAGGNGQAPAGSDDPVDPWPDLPAKHARMLERARANLPALWTHETFGPRVHAVRSAIESLGGGFLEGVPDRGWPAAVALPSKAPDGRIVGLKLRALEPTDVKSRSLGRCGIIGHEQLEAKPQAMVVLVAGERDQIHTLARIPDWAVISAAGGESQGVEAFAHMVAGRLVAIIYDADESGRAGAQKAAATLAKAGAQVRVVDLPLPGTPESKDVLDFIRAHGADALRELVENAPAWEPSGDVEPEQAGERPEIRITTRLTEMVDAAESALIDDENTELFVRVGQLVRVIQDDPARARKGKMKVRRPKGLPVIAPAHADWLTERLASAAQWMKFGHREKDWVPALPQTQVVKSLAVRGEWRLPWLESIHEHPTLREDGSVLQEPGYDPDTGVLLRPHGQFPRVPDLPSADDVREAIETLIDPIREFSFENDSDRAAALAIPLSIVARPAIDGPMPLFAISAPTPGEGKSLLGHVQTVAAGGRPPSLATWTDETAEQRKMVMSFLLEGLPVILLDNLETQLGGATLAAILTAWPEYRDRILGVLKSASAPNRTIWIATGNNLSFKGDTYRRVVPIHLDGQTEKPEDRQFRVADLRGFVRDHRADLCAAALTILRAYHVAGRPLHGASRIGSFEAWDNLVRGALCWALDVDPTAGRDRVRLDADPEIEAMTALFAAWRRAFPNEGFIALKQVAERARSLADLSADGAGDMMLLDALESVAVKDKGGPDLRGIGNRLRRWKGRIAGGIRLEKGTKTKHGASWRTVRVNPARGDSGDSGDSSLALQSSPRVHAGPHDARGGSLGGLKDSHQSHQSHPCPCGSPATTESGHCTTCASAIRDLEETTS